MSGARSHAHAVKVSQCVWCTATFSRRPWSDDTLRYCTRECYFAMKKARAHERHEVLAVEQQLEQELRRSASAAIRALRRCRACAGSIPADRGGSYCSDVCRRAGIGTNLRATRRTNKGASGIQHLCPNCGQWFTGHPGDVFCSSRCAHQLKPCYPRIRRIASIEERNRLAELIYLVRAANRRIDETLNPSNPNWDR